MRNHPDSSPPRRTWQAMLASLRTCLSCGRSLLGTASSLDGFCPECVDRSRDLSDDHLGGEA